MTKIELLEMLTNQARKFRADTGHYERNSHMHAIKDAPPQEVVDAVLTGFINAIGIMQGVDYALYASDLAKEADGDGQNVIGHATAPTRRTPMHGKEGDK
jgi:hypothetical protein